MTKNNTYVQNPEFPSGSTRAQMCTWGIDKPNRDICHFRLDFVRFELAGVDLTTNADRKGGCETDLMTFTQGNGGYTGEKACITNMARIKM